MLNNNARAVLNNPSGTKCTSEPICGIPKGLILIGEDIRVKELKNFECLGADRGFVPPSVRLYDDKNV